MKAARQRGRGAAHGQRHATGVRGDEPPAAEQGKAQRHHEVVVEQARLAGDVLPLAPAGIWPYYPQLSFLAEDMCADEGRA
jgi:hypothetical protein